MCWVVNDGFVYFYRRQTMILWRRLDDRHIGLLRCTFDKVSSLRDAGIYILLCRQAPVFLKLGEAPAERRAQGAALEHVI